MELQQPASTSVQSQQVGANVTLIHSRTVYTDHEIDLGGGVSMREVRETSDQSTLDGKPYRTLLLRRRSIGDRTITEFAVESSESGGEVIPSASRVDTEMDAGEVSAFEEEWRAKWRPRVEAGALKEFEEEANNVAAIQEEIGGEGDSTVKAKGAAPVLVGSALLSDSESGCSNSTEKVNDN